MGRIEILRDEMGTYGKILIKQGHGTLNSIESFLTVNATLPLPSEEVNLALLEAPVMSSRK